MQQKGVGQGSVQDHRALRSWTSWGGTAMGGASRKEDWAGTGRAVLELWSRAAAAAELRLEAEELDALVIVHLVHLRQLRGEVLLGDIRQARVDDVEHELMQ
jgi:hypothetical protein